MLKKFNFEIAKIGTVTVSAASWEKAREILQAYIDKRSLDWVVINDG